MMKILGSILGLLMGSTSLFGRGLNIDFKGIQASVFDELAVRTRKPVMLVLLGFCATMFFCVGSFMAIIDATRQFDLTGTVVASATLWTGIGIAAATLGGYIYIFMHEWPGLKEVNAQRKAEHEAYEREQENQAQYRPSDVEGALAALLMDFVESRKNRREHRFAEREQRRADREARRAEREAKRGTRYEQSGTSWNADQNQSNQEPPRH
ncbi:hypothetical protein B9G69_010850 [Bdellovibrio sp. SKB1291214]|uniref:hypothetical protein n=1 Tax=Bdellovibrio sp. SKB1291214 TaxID=1732569 RepID=UPI000B514D81|nr:hypothetical protein [Bdellovibrio sp. SKB1291214]UYL07542.1 hypothetical protein B9G69_010850 [Bdellovibrio sp. SKB1291214]